MKTTKSLVALFMLISATVFSQQNQMQENFNLIKLNLSESKNSIKKYSWIETTTVYVNGEQKSVSQNQCYYDVNGVLTKVPTGATTQAATPRGIRGRIAENKKDEMEEYVKKAVAQIKLYIPPQPETLQSIYAAGKVGIKIIEPQKQFELDFPNYLLSGDMVAIKVDLARKVLMGYGVNTYIDDPSDAVSLDVKFQNLPNGTSYSGDVTFNAPSKNLKIEMVNSGYRIGSGQ